MSKVNYKKIIVVLGGIAIGTTIVIDKFVKKSDKCNSVLDEKKISDNSTHDANEYNHLEYDRFGYDSNGYDVNGYNRNGFDIDGYDRFGYDAEGYRRNGFGVDGYNRNGYNREGYDRTGYNIEGVDKAGCCKQYYSDFIKQLRKRLDEAYQQMQCGQFRYALYDARIVLEEALKLLVQHTFGEDNVGDSIWVNLKICERGKLLGNSSEFVDKLHEVRHICNVNGHVFGADEKMNYNKVYFVSMQIKDLLNWVDDTLVYT